MSDIAYIALGLLVSVLGMGCFALAIDAHWRQLLGSRPMTRAATLGLRIGGAVLLGLAFWFCAAADPLSMAALVWPMLLTIAAALVAAGLSLQAARARRRQPARSRR